MVAIAANAFAVTAESLCYMPGYGIGDAATALTGQSHGAGRPLLVRRFGFMAVGLGMAVMSVMGLLMYLFAPDIMAMITPVEDIKNLGAEVLRIEAWAEPMFAASIVAYGAFVGVGETKLPAFMNFGSIWLVRVPLAWWLARRMDSHDDRAVFPRHHLPPASPVLPLVCTSESLDLNPQEMNRTPTIGNITRLS